MEPNPYEAPRGDCPAEPAPVVPGRTVRRGVPLVVALVWNVPLAVILTLTFCEVIGIKTMERALFAWGLAVPIFSIVLILFPFVQRMVYLPHVDMAKMRPKLWSLAALWFAIYVVWVVIQVAGGTW